MAKHLRSPEVLTAYALLKGPRGSKIIRMAIDTGATITIVPFEATLPIGCDPAKSKRRTSIITASGKEYLPVVTIPLVACLGQRVRSLKVACHELPPESTVDGLLGLDFLSRVPAFQKFQRAVLRLTKE